MKLLFAECCKTIVVPHNLDGVVTPCNYCRCAQACCWWINGQEGIFGCHSSLGRLRVSILGISNDILWCPIPDDRLWVDGETIKLMIEATPSNYYFSNNHMGSLIIRVRPGATSDIKFFERVEDVPR